MTSRRGFPATGDAGVPKKWITHREAAQLLGVHPSLISKVLRHGDLTSRDQRPSLPRQQVLDLAAKRSH